MVDLKNKNKKIFIFRISCLYHYSASYLLEYSEIIYSFQEEIFSRIKHEARFPTNAIKYYLESNNNLYMRDKDYLVYYEKPFTYF